MSAVSKKLIPASNAACRMALTVSGSVTLSPKVVHPPSPNTLTFVPQRPSGRYCIEDSAVRVSQK